MSKRINEETWVRICPSNLLDMWPSTNTCAQLCLTLYNHLGLAHQALISVGFFREEHWCGLPFIPPRDCPYQGIKPSTPAWNAGSLPLSPQGTPFWFDIWMYIWKNPGARSIWKMDLLCFLADTTLTCLIRGKMVPHFLNALCSGKRGTRAWLKPCWLCVLTVSVSLRLFLQLYNGKQGG